MKFYCYIIYSESINRYYVGYTTNIEERISLHNTGHFGGKSYTHITTDWELFLLIPCETVSQAIYIESKIKRMKSRKYIENLKKFPEIIEKMVKGFHN
jgi:putative endonuclease